MNLPTLEAELFLYDGSASNPIQMNAVSNCPFIAKVQ
jgi:hypothetical protein